MTDHPANGVSPQLAALAPRVAAMAKGYQDELVALRRQMHSHPEIGRQEYRTTGLVAGHLEAAGLSPVVLPNGVGLICDIGPAPADGVGFVGLRADLDALPIPDEKDVPYRSTIPGVCHACGHDVHTAALVGAGRVLHELHRTGDLPVPVRLVFQPAEESTPGGAIDVLDAGVIEGIDRIFALHCDPRADVGSVGLRVGAITGSADHLLVRMTGPGGHTARPHLTADLIYALARVVADVPSVLSRRVDPRAGLSLVWGRIIAGGAANVIPQAGEAEGTVRSLDASAWQQAPRMVEEAVRAVAAPYLVDVEVSYTRGVPPVVNDEACVAIQRSAAETMFGPFSVYEMEQSLGGEDFAWYLEKVPGALARIGVRTPGDGRVRDLHQGVFDADERAIGVGLRLFVGSALLSVR